jgi:hypothetical protein
MSAAVPDATVPVAGASAAGIVSASMRGLAGTYPSGIRDDLVRYRVDAGSRCGNRLFRLDGGKTARGGSP